MGGLWCCNSRSGVLFHVAPFFEFIFGVLNKQRMKLFISLQLGLVFELAVRFMPAVWISPAINNSRDMARNRLTSSQARILSILRLNNVYSQSSLCEDHKYTLMFWVRHEIEMPRPGLRTANYLLSLGDVYWAFKLNVLLLFCFGIVIIANCHLSKSTVNGCSTHRPWHVKVRWSIKLVEIMKT